MFINSFHDPKSEAYCDDCGLPLITKYKNSIEASKQKLLDEIKGSISIVPIVTLNNPVNWVYNVVDMISAQSISGTGFLTELSGSWADFTGGQSNSMANKVSSGEDICKNKLRYQCVLMGGNAVLGTDIDYSEVGGGKGMLMVCMAGTAVDVNLDQHLFDDKREELKQIKTTVDEYKKLSEITFPALVLS